MYHEERIINGKLHWRGTPTGEWIESVGAVADAANALAVLPDFSRLAVCSFFCGSCGCIQEKRRCQCWNDE
jgi:hypothetical protein